MKSFRITRQGNFDTLLDLRTGEKHVMEHTDDAEEIHAQAKLMYDVTKAMAKYRRKNPIPNKPVLSLVSNIESPITDKE